MEHCNIWCITITLSHAVGSCSEKAQHQNMVLTVTFWFEYGLSEGLHKKIRSKMLPGLGAMGRWPLPQGHWKTTGSKFNVCNPSYQP